MPPHENPKMTVALSDMQKIVYGDHHDPFAVLGMHAIAFEGKKAIAIRSFMPDAREIKVIETGGSGKEYAMVKIDPLGFFELLLHDRATPFSYVLEITDYFGSTRRRQDPYRFPPVLSDFDLHLHGEGNHWQIYEKLGCHLMTVDGVAGAHFSVWAPNARRVSVVGNFNNWDGRWHPMRQHPGAGVWEIFIPELGEGELYKYEIKTQRGELRIKTDPYAFRTELRPATASIAHDISKFLWHDENWMAARAARAASQFDHPIAIYEVHLGSWKRVVEENHRPLTYRELAHQLADYVNDMGYTHVELLPVMEYPYDPSWGYQVTGYYAPTSRYGAPDDFAYFVDYLHQHNIGVILDWVPAHFPKDDTALRWFDGTELYEHADPRKGEHPDWGTLIFNYGRNEVRNFLIANAHFWLEKYHIDGLRVDAVASMLYLDYSRKAGEWLPNKYGGRENLEAIDFLKRLSEVVYGRHAGVMMIAEESTAWPSVSRPTYLGGLGFSFKWNMGWMNDFLRYMKEDPVHRKYHHHLITFSMLYAFTENFILVLSHDEVVHGKRSLLDKMPGDLWQRFANMRLALGYMYGHPGKKLLFMGAEFGQWQEWNHASSLEWHLLQFEPHRKLQKYVRDLNQLYRREPALYEVDYSWEGFQWIDFQDSDASLISFFRRAKNQNEVVVFACNFTPVPRENYRLGVPLPGFYREVLNSDGEMYGGSNRGNYGGVRSEKKPWHGQPHSIIISFPPLAVVVFKREEILIDEKII
jgi:1,4-alpha-glucan branching enzyme